MTQKVQLPHIQKMFFIEDREQFAHAQEASDGWVILGLSIGLFRYALDDQPFRECNPGDLIIAHPGQTLKREIIRKCNFYAIYFDWHPENTDCLPNGKYTPVDIPRYLSTLSYWKTIGQHRSQELFARRANTLLFDFLQQLEYESHQPRAQEVNDPDRQIFQVAELLRRTENTEYSLTDLSRKVGISPSQISRRFYAVFGVTPVVYRTQHKLQKACHYLLNTDWSLERIAESCGFANAFYFSRVFSKHMKCAPSEYRRTHSL